MPFAADGGIRPFRFSGKGIPLNPKTAILAGLLCACFDSGCGTVANLAKKEYPVISGPMDSGPTGASREMSTGLQPAIWRRVSPA